MKKRNVFCLGASILVAGLLAVFSFIMWWPTPACPEDDFLVAMSLMGTLLEVPLVSQEGSFICDNKLPWLVEERRSLKQLIDPPPLRLGIGPSDPKNIKYKFQSTNSQIQVTASITSGNVVYTRVDIFGSDKTARAIKCVLSNWVPTSKLPSEIHMSEIELWKRENEHKKIEGSE
jgi:hypothetical protein